MGGKTKLIRVVCFSLLLVAASIAGPNSAAAESPNDGLNVEGRLKLLAGYDDNVTNAYKFNDNKESAYLRFLVDSTFVKPLLGVDTRVNYTGTGQHYEKYSDTEDHMVNRITLYMLPHKIPSTYFKLYYKSKIYNSEHDDDFHKVGFETWLRKGILPRAKGQAAIKFFKLDQPDRNEYDYNAWQVYGELQYHISNHLNLSFSLGYFEKYYSSKAFRGVGYYADQGLVDYSTYEMEKTAETRLDESAEASVSLTWIYDWILIISYDFSNEISNHFGNYYDNHNFSVTLTVPVGDSIIVNAYARYRDRIYRHHVKNVQQSTHYNDLRIGTKYDRREGLSFLRLTVEKYITDSFGAELTYSRHTDSVFVSDDYEKNDFMAGIKYSF